MLVPNCINYKMQGIAFTTCIFAFSAYAEVQYPELLLAGAPANILRARPSCSRYADPEMIKECRFGIKTIQKPQAEKFAVNDAMTIGARKQLEKADVIFTVDGAGLTVAQKDEMKSKLPAGVFTCTVKNSLMRKVVKEFPAFVKADALCKGANIWFFVKFEDLRETIEALKDWRTKSGVDPDVYVIKGGAMDGTFLDTKGVNGLSKLPTKQELMGKVAYMINSIPTKIAKGINEVPSKVARGINAASAERLSRAIKLMQEKMDQ